MGGGRLVAAPTGKPGVHSIQPGCIGGGGGYYSMYWVGGGMSIGIEFFYVRGVKEIPLRVGGGGMGQNWAASALLSWS